MILLTEHPPQAVLEHRSSVVTTKTGRSVTTRLLGHEDAPLLVDLFNHLSEHTRRLRFSKPRSDDEIIWREAARLSQRDPNADTTLVGVVREDGQDRVVALVQVVRATDTTMAEIAAVVRDDYQNEGLGRTLCRLAVQIAVGRGVRTLQILTQAENRVVQWLVRSMGVPYTAQVQYGEVTIMVQLAGA